ncbi:hypothetical protein [Mycolicibacterium brisbanense]|uniref:Helix-turn-helix family protein n=1 Tax=Mycolicibacterium brisbanense TaxID=146020 RepID=A0A117I7N4_9MYCO|nr:hypothetical protein [Mycolicibacterium brisbanense]MCV7162618.1 hypothetical protein [Mycolicibacterium brisbanense]GAS91967.1 helix-turn-helix family protein [Mycolicibacterium brisbanense]
MTDIEICGPYDVRPGDMIVGKQLYGKDSPVVERHDIVVAAAGEHPSGGECIRLRREPPYPAGFELNYWRNLEYFDETLLHVQRASCGNHAD